MENSKVKAYKETALKINPHLVAVKMSGYYQIKNGAGHSVSDWFISEDEAWKSVCSCFEVVSEEESNHIAGVGKKVSVEEAAENKQPFEAHPRLADILLHAANHWKVDTTNWNALLAEINKICTLYSELEKVTDKVEDLQILLDAERNAIQSGEYVSLSDVEDALLKVGHIRPSVIIRVLETLKNKQ